MHIKDRTFVVSGGASGLGLATCQLLSQQGGYVAVLDMNEENGQRVAKDLGNAKFWSVDVSDTDSVEAAVQGIVAWVKETGKEIGGVVAAAGVGNPGKMIDRDGEPLSLEGFDFVMNINVRGTIDLIRQLLPTMVKNKPVGATEQDGDGERGVLILVSSVAAFDGQPGQVSYSASKGAVASLTLPLARDLAQHGIRAVTIAPGVFESAMTRMMSNKVRSSLERVMEFPKRMGQAEEFASLCSEVIKNRMLNATVLRLDAGVRMPSKM